MNRESERKRLVELCEDVVLSCKSSLCADCEHNKIDYPHCMSEHFADHLLVNGIVVPLCKVGDAIFRIDDKRVFDWWDVEHIEIYADETVYIDDSGNQFTEEDIGRKIFITREEAEKMVKRKEDEGK